MQTNISQNHGNLKYRSNGNQDQTNNYQDKYRDTNRELIKYIYSTVDISQFKFEIIKGIK
jgi:hypothetical protein